MKTKVHQIKKTSDYTIFTRDPANRLVRNTKKLRVSMQQYGFLPAFPILVVRRSGKLVILDGQHRFEAARDLGIPVLFMEIAEEEAKFSISEIQLGKAWVITDYINEYTVKKNEHYSYLGDFIQRHNIPPVVAASLLYGQQGGSGNVSQQLKIGRFEVRDPEYAETVALIVAEASTYVKLSINNLFIDAISKCVRVPSFNPTEFRKRMRQCPGLLHLQPTSDMFLETIESIYNYRAKKPIPLKFLAQQAARERNASQSSMDNAAKKRAGAGIPT